MNDMHPAHGTQRMRLSAWANQRYLRKENITSGKDIIDDISLIRIVRHRDNVKIDGPGKLELLPLDPLDKNWLPTVIRFCHENKMQVLAGYSFSHGKQPKESDRFNEWLDYLVKTTNEGDRNSEVDRFADKIVDFVIRDFAEGDGLRFDGINFDIESLPLMGDKPVDVRERFALERGGILKQFYQTVHDKLAASVMKNPVVAVAAGQLVAHKQAAGVLPRHQWLAFFNPTGDRTIPCPKCHGEDSSKCDLCEGSGKGQKPITRGNPAHPSAIAHDYRMAQNHPNLIIRPMAYDTFDRSQSDATWVRQWHLDIVEYALSIGGAKQLGAGIERANFQLGIKNFEDKGNRPPDNLDSLMLDDGEAHKRCIDLRNKCVGLCVFMMPAQLDLSTFWRRATIYNDGLNAKVGGKGTYQTGVENQPLQVPHTVESLARLAVC